MLKYRHIDKLTKGARFPRVTEDYSTGEEYILDKGVDSKGEYFKMTRKTSTKEIITFYYKNGQVEEVVR